MEVLSGDFLLSDLVPAVAAHHTPVTTVIHALSPLGAAGQSAPTAGAQARRQHMLGLLSKRLAAQCPFLVFDPRATELDAALMVECNKLEKNVADATARVRYDEARWIANAIKYARVQRYAPAQLPRHDADP